MTERQWKKIKEAGAGLKDDIAEIGKMAKEAKQVSSIARDVHFIIQDIDKQFAEATKLNRVDISFLFLAIALQVVRQYFLTNFKERLDHNKSADSTKKSENKLKQKEAKRQGSDVKSLKKESRNSKHSWYEPSLQEVIFNPVPFDQTPGGGKNGFDIFKYPKGSNQFIRGFRHRAVTLGHDPILGWIFGTANIATATLTTWNLRSFHVKYQPNAKGILVPTIANNADTHLVFKHTGEKIINKDIQDKMVIGSSLIKEGLHLKSDIGSFAGLPIPVVSKFSPEFAEQLASYGIDMANIASITNQAAYAIMINCFIAMIHALFYNENRDGCIDLYKVRTRKILSYSNVVASASNIIAVAIGSAIGIGTDNPKLISKSLSYLDIGGLMVTLYRIVSDYQFINEIKQEFLAREFYKIVMGDDFNYDDYNY